MFHTAKTLAIAAALMTLPASAAFAQGDFGVSSNVQTLGMPGGFSDYSNGLPLDAFEYRESDPVGGNWGNQPNNTVFADGAARGWAATGELRVATDATANPLSATAFPNSYPYGFAEVRYWDTLTVASDSLPAGTPVTLVFRNELVANVAGEGIFAGSFYGQQVIAGRSVNQQVTFSYYDMDFAAGLGNITVNTKVGASFKLSGRLYLHTRGHYYAMTAEGRRYGGASEGEVSLKPVLDSVSGDVHLVSASGTAYPLGGN